MVRWCGGGIEGSGGGGKWHHHGRRFYVELVLGFVWLLK
jgi:hypothetical protein